MARVTHTAVTVPGALDFDGAAITFVAATPASDEQVVLTGREMLIAQNVHGSSAFTVTVTSVNDPFGRTKDIAADSIAAGDFKIYGPFATTGWQQTDGNLYFEASDANIEFVVLKLALP